jgi:phage baseplate assembly protein W
MRKQLPYVIRYVRDSQNAFEYLTDTLAIEESQILMFLTTIKGSRLMNENLGNKLLITSLEEFNTDELQEYIKSEIVREIENEFPNIRIVSTSINEGKISISFIDARIVGDALKELPRTLTLKLI